MLTEHQFLYHSGKKLECNITLILEISRSDIRSMKDVI